MSTDSAPARERRLKFDIVVHGRFHGFHLARGLIALGHDVLVHTNYPRMIAARFGIPPASARSFLAHGVATRVAEALRVPQTSPLVEPLFHRMFGRWAARGVREDADLVYGFSGVMEEVLRRPRRNPRQTRVMVRGSAHILEQARLLEEEEARLGVPVLRPSPWMIAREEREYALADHIVVLSRFARDSFIDRGFSPTRLALLPLGVDLKRFVVTPEAIAAREARILGGGPLRVLNVGTLSAQKGVFDFVRIAEALRRDFDFRFVGTVVPGEAGHFLKNANGAISISPRVPEFHLTKAYAEADIFLFTTIQDGFAAILLQAATSGLPVLSTRNCSGPDFIEEGETGWTVGIRDADAFVERLRWCAANRPALAAMARRAAAGSHSRDWSVMARELVALARADGSSKS